ncbi:MAG: hypothetical protein WAZ10_04085 [Minisyncoccia bacterium]
MRSTFLNNLASKILLFLVFLFLFTPLVSHAQFVYECPGVGGIAGECTFDDLIRAVRRVTNEGTKFALGFSVIVIAWAGFRFMMGGESASERAKAAGMLLKVVQGIAIIIIAWVLVRLITTALLDDNIPTFLG